MIPLTGWSDTQLFVHDPSCQGIEQGGKAQIQQGIEKARRDGDNHRLQKASEKSLTQGKVRYKDSNTDNYGKEEQEAEQTAETPSVQKGCLNDYCKKGNGRLGDILIENPKSTIQVGEAKDKTGDFPFFTSGDSILRWTEPIVDGRNTFLNTGGNADVKFYVGKTAYSTDTWCITARNDMEDYLYLLLNSIRQELDLKYFQGTGLKHLQKPLLKDRAVYIPSDSEISNFNAEIKPWLTMISNNTRESYRLSALRDWLLPMLMNGQATIAD